MCCKESEALDLDTKCWWMGARGEVRYFGKDDGERLVEIKVEFEGRQLVCRPRYTYTSVGSCRDFPPPHVSLFTFSKKLPELLSQKSEMAGSKFLEL